MLNTVAVFQSDVFNPDAGWDEAAGIQRIPAGEDFAKHLGQLLPRHGIRLDPDTPIDDETAWVLFLNFGGMEYQIRVSWAVSHDKADRKRYWAVFISAQSPGLLRSLFTKAEVDELKIRPLRDVLERILLNDAVAGRVYDVEWMAEGQFWNRYSC